MMLGRLIVSAVGGGLMAGGFLSAMLGPVGSGWHYGGALAVLAGGLLLVRLIVVAARVDVSAEA
jgi:hypothetical protein